MLRWTVSLEPGCAHAFYDCVDLLVREKTAGFARETGHGGVRYAVGDDAALRGFGKECLIFGEANRSGDRAYTIFPVATGAIVAIESGWVEDGIRTWHQWLRPRLPGQTVAAARKEDEKREC